MATTTDAIGEQRSTTTMKALVIRRFGGADVARVEEVPTPVPGPGEVRVRLLAAALNPLDNKIRAGAMPGLADTRFPLVLGWDGAGVIDAVGPGVDAFAVGDEVLGLMQAGTLAEYVVSPADAPLTRKPRQLDWTAAAALPEAGLTALEIAQVGELAEGRSVLVIGATGGIGSLLVPIAKLRAATVLATADGASRDYVLGLGADATFDFRGGDPVSEANAMGGVDVVVDLINQGDALVRSAAALKPGGVLVSTLFGPDPSEMSGQPFTLRYVRLAPSGDALRALVDLVVREAFPVQIGQTHPLDDAAEALRSLEDGSVLGKSVVTISPS